MLVGGRTMRFRDKVAIVTGAASGIGLATARRLGSEGARVVIADLKGDAAERSAASLREAGAPDALGVACDVSSDVQVAGTVKAAMDRFARLDVVVNNAGLMTFKSLEELTSEDWQKVLNVDLFGAVHFTKQAFMTEPLVAPYAAAKSAVVSLTRSASIEGKDKGIRVNVVLPGAIDTPMLWDNPNVKSGAEKVDRSMVGRPEDIAAAIAFLASDDAAFVTGTALRVDGGRLDRL